MEYDRVRTVSCQFAGVCTEGHDCWQSSCPGWQQALATGGCSLLESGAAGKDPWVHLPIICLQCAFSISCDMTSVLAVAQFRRAASRLRCCSLLLVLVEFISFKASSVS